jgi:putative membrane protein
MRNQFSCVLTATAVLLLAGAPVMAQQDPDRPRGGTSAGAPGDQTRDPGRPTGEPGTSDPRKPAGDQADSSKAKDSSGDEKFIKEAALGGIAEVELGRLAAQKASSSEVKQFAQKMVDDHGKANDELSTIAKQKSIAIPTELTDKHKKTVERLSKLPAGEEFDRTYMKLMLDDHKKDVSEFRKAASKAGDAEVKTFASQRLPTLEEHLRAAQQFESSRREVRGTSGTNPPAGPRPDPGQPGRPEPGGIGGSPDPLGRPGPAGGPGSGPGPTGPGGPGGAGGER